jgi:hypothetical protein
MKREGFMQRENEQMDNYKKFSHKVNGGKKKKIEEGENLRADARTLVAAGGGNLAGHGMTQQKFGPGRTENIFSPAAALLFSTKDKPAAWHSFPSSIHLTSV